jgi:hypothetical protein
MITKERINQIKMVNESEAVLFVDYESPSPKENFEILQLALKGLAAERLEKALEEVLGQGRSQFSDFTHMLVSHREEIRKALTEYRAEIGVSNG